jgi:hypothetical protein
MKSRSVALRHPVIQIFYTKQSGTLGINLEYGMCHIVTHSEGGKLYPLAKRPPSASLLLSPASGRENNSFSSFASGKQVFTSPGT